MAFPTKTWEAVRALHGANVAGVITYFDPNDTNPIALIASPGNTDRALGINMSAAFDATTGLFKPGVISALTASAAELNTLHGGIVVNKLETMALAGAADTAGGIGAWQNPEAVEIHIDLLIITSSVVATSACTLDAGVTEANATTLSDNLIDGLDLHSALLLGNSNLTDPGANGKAAKALAAGKWITFSTATGAAAAFAGKAYIRYTTLS